MRTNDSPPSVASLCAARTAQRAIPTCSDVSRAQFSLANREDDTNIRRLLRENPMQGIISITLEREPDYFADEFVPGTEKQTIIARENGHIVCVGSCSVRERFVNGRPCRVGYLGGLRLDQSASGRFDILRRGYEFFRELQQDNPPDFFFTSIASDNVRAQKFLERNLRGMPLYEYLGEFVTLLIPARGSGAKSEVPCVASYNTLNEYNLRYQLSPCWSAAEFVALESLGLQYFESAALWDQHSFKQTVVRDYSPWLKWTRPILSAFSRVAGTPRLPTAGEILPNAFISHLAVASDDFEKLVKIISKLSSIGASRSIELLTLGFAANDPRLPIVQKKFRCREYRSRLYIVRWPGMGGAANDLDSRVLAPEVSLL